MSEENVIVIIAGGIMRQGTLFVDVMSKSDFHKTTQYYEKYYSPEYNGCKSPVINKSIQEIRNIIKNVIEKSDEEVTEDNKSIQEDSKKKVKKSRFIDGTEFSYNFKIQEFKKLISSEFNFQYFNSFNRKEKNVKKDSNFDSEDEKNAEVSDKKAAPKKTNSKVSQDKKNDDSDSDKEKTLTPAKEKKVIKKKTTQKIKDKENNDSDNSDNEKIVKKKSNSKANLITVKKTTSNVDDDSEEDKNIAETEEDSD